MTTTTKIVQRGSSAYVLIGVLALACFASTFSCPTFLIDDRQLLFGSWSVWDDPAGIVRIWTGEMHPAEMHYRPVADSMLWAGLQIWGENVIGFRILNLSVFLITVALGIRIYRRMGLRGAEWIGLFVMLHPLNVQAVMWLAQIRQLVACLFVTAGILAFVNQHQRQSVRWGFVGLVCLALALLSKSVAVSFPVLLIVIGLIGRVRPTRQTWLFLGASIVVTIVGAAVEMRVMSQFVPELGPALPVRVANTGMAFVQAVRNVLVPYPLGYLYDIDVGVPEMVCMASLVLAPIALWRSKGRQAALQFGLVIAAVLVILGPVTASHTASLSLSPIMDRYVAYSLFIVAPYVAYLLAPALQPGRRRRRYTIAALVVIAAAFFIESARQARHYSDPQRFYVASARVSPHSIGLRLFWAMSLREADRFDDAQRVIAEGTAMAREAKRMLGDPSAPAEYRRFNRELVPFTLDLLNGAFSVESAQVALGRKAHAEVLAGLPLEDPSLRVYLELVPVVALAAAIRLESDDPTIRNEAEAARLLLTLEVELLIAAHSGLRDTWRHWGRLRLNALQASLSAARGEFDTARQLVTSVLADRSLALPGRLRARVREDLNRRLQAYEHEVLFRSPESQLLWRLNTNSLW